MLDDVVLARFMSSFFGYGRLQARVWFVGMEEGGGQNLEGIQARLSAWQQRGQPPVDDVAAFHKAFGQERWFVDGAPTQSTRRQLIRTVLVAWRLISTYNNDESKVGRHKYKATL